MDTIFYSLNKQDRMGFMLESWLINRKGLTVGKDPEITAFMFTGKQDWITHKSPTGLQEAKRCVKVNKSVYQEQKGLYSTGHGEILEGKVASMNVLHSLLVSVGDIYHGTHGLQHQVNEEDTGT